MRAWLGVAFPLVLASVMLPGMASAQQLGPRTSIVSDEFRDRLSERGRNESVRQRGRPEYDPAGVRLGGFTAFPVIDLEVYSTDNLLRSESDELAALGLNTRLGSTIRSNWSVHELSVVGSVGYNQNNELSSENITTIDLNGSGRLDISRGRNLQGQVRFSRGAEPRGSSGSVTDSKSPIEFDQYGATTGLLWEFSRLRLAARADTQTFDYKDGQSLSGRVIDQSERDRTQNTLTGRVEYAQSPSIAWYGEISANERAYDVSSTTARDSTGVSVLVGSSFDISGLTRGEIGIGYISQNYDKTIYEDQSGLGVRAAVEWFPSRRVTIAGTVSRTIDDSAIVNSGSIISTAYGVQADYELRRNIIVTGRAQLVNADYSGLNRKDKTTELSASAAYLLNRTAALSFFVTNSSLSSSGAQFGPKFAETRVGVRLTLRR
jgi:hypothetical protein